MSSQPLHRRNVMESAVSVNVRHVVRSMCRAIDSPFARKLDSDISSGDRDLGIANSRLDPSTYVSWTSFRDDYLLSSILTKYPGLNTGLDLKEIGLRSFLGSESACLSANNRLVRPLASSLTSCLTMHSVMFTARRKIGRLLGPFSWDRAEEHFSFGPGATFGLRHREGDAYYKFRSQPDVTAGCAVLAFTALRRVPRWFEHVAALAGESPDKLLDMSPALAVRRVFRIVPGNRVTFVPKDAKKLRTIAIEPLMNGFIQHGIGKLIRLRLKRAGVNLDDQFVNQQMAKEASVSNRMATLDLSAASDSICLELVRSLLPEDWFDAVMSCRSPIGVLPDGTEVKYQKVSSMGNGFTFELESLIFWALSSACCDLLHLEEHHVSVYGDDIISPSWAVPTIRWVLNFCGFTLNESKSFADGPFRESCGKHYFLGHDVTPFYIREDVDAPSRIFWLCNQIHRWSRLSFGLDPRLEVTYLKARAKLPACLRNQFVPDCLGDFGLVSDLDIACPERGRGLWSSMWSVRVWLPMFKGVRKSDTAYLLRQLSGMCTEPSSLNDRLFLYLLRHGWLKKKQLRLATEPGLVVNPDRVVWRRVTVSVADWPSFGEFLS